MTKASRSLVKLLIYCSAWSLLFYSKLALTRDLDGKYSNPPLKQWFESLASRRGPCCSAADGQIEVPPDALVTVSNKFGLAVLWPYKDYEGRAQIRCFIPGAGG